MKEPIMEKVLRYLRIGVVVDSIKDNSVVCDIGCGYNAKFLLSISGKIHQGYGFDQKLEVKTIGNIELNRLRLENKIDLPDNSVDYVTMLAFLEHVDNPDNILKEVKRILKKDGQLLITIPTVHAKPILEFLAFTLGVINKDEILDHKHYYSKEELKTLCKKHGFKVKECKYFECMMNMFSIVEK